MTVLELMATMGIDTTSFDDGLSKAVDAVDDLSEKTESLTNPKLGGGTTGGSVLKPLKEDADSVDQQLLKLQTTSKETSALVDGFVDATGEAVKAAIDWLIEYGKQSVEAAASTGSELANAFNQARADFDVTLELAKIKTGETILPFLTGLYEMVNEFAGVSGEDKLQYIAQQLQEYSDLNLEEVRNKLEGVFGTFEKVGEIKPGNLGDYQEGLESQTEYWNNYADTLGSLKEKGVDPEFLAEIADGSKKSMEVLSALDAADASGLESLLEAYGNMKTAQEAAAQGISDTQLSADETMDGMLESMATFVAGLDQSETSKANASATVGGIVAGLSESFPAVGSWVDEINKKFSELGTVFEPDNPNNPYGNNYHGSGEEPTVTVDTVVSEESEGNLQGAVDNMSLTGNADLYADPSSAGLIQSWLNTQSFTATVELIPTGGGGTSRDKGSTVSKRAVGLDYVPYNDYPADLHEGEAVLTKLEADHWRAGEEGAARASAAPVYNVTINVNETSASAEDISDAVLEALDLARWKA